MKKQNRFFDRRFFISIASILFSTGLQQVGGIPSISFVVNLIDYIDLRTMSGKIVLPVAALLVSGAAAYYLLVLAPAAAAPADQNKNKNDVSTNKYLLGAATYQLGNTSFCTITEVKQR